MEHGISAYIILFVFISVLLTFLCYEVRKLTKLPVSPLLLIVGVIARVLAGYLGMLGHSFTLVDHIDPHLILLGVMPALIFEAALATDWHTFKSELPQIIPLATTVVVISAVLTAVCFTNILGYEFDWSHAILLGVILSATDHVTVVAQLKDIKGDRRFETLIEGETLLNEATVIVIFTVMLESIGGEGSVGESILFFLRLSFGGFVMGIVFALAMGFLLARLINDSVQEIVLTLMTAYLLFFTCDGTPLHVSGALATVTLGLYMSAYGITLVSPVVEHSLHGFWSVIGTVSESIVFIIGGMILGMVAINHEHLYLSDVWMLLALFLLLHLVRGVAVFLHYPILKRFGYGIKFTELIVVILAGFKGVISLALALIAFHNESLDARFKSLMLFFTVGISALTIIFDTLFVKLAVYFFKMETLSSVQENMMLGVTTAIIQKTAEEIKTMRADKEFKLVRWDKVEDLAGPKRLLKQVMENTPTGRNILSKYPNENYAKLLEKYSSEFILTKEELSLEMRRRFMTTLKGIYWHEFESGQCLGYTSLVLMDSCNRCLDKPECPLEDWEILKKEIYSSKMLKLYISLSKVPVVGRIFRDLLYERIIMVYDAASTFIKAHEEAKELIDHMEIDTDEDLFELVMKQAEEQVEQCKEFIMVHITEGYPEVIADVQSKKACHSLLITQRKLIEEVYEQGVIEEIEHDHLLEAIDENLKTLTRGSTSSLPPLKTQLENRFREATPEDIENLNEEITTIHLQPEQVLFKEGQESEGAYLILGGRVKESSTWIDQELSVGNIVGVQHLLPQFKQNVTTATCISLVYAAKIPKWVAEKESFVKDIYLEAAEEIIQYNIKKLEMETVKQDLLYYAIKHSQVRIYKEGTEVNPNELGLLFEGALESGKDAPTLLVPGLEEKVAKTSIVLIFPSLISNEVKNGTDLAKAFDKFYFSNTSKKLAIARKAESELFTEVTHKTKAF
mgnify:CR=1 FL=1